ncbi:MAG: PEP-CTERM sorting domain-containing protein [Acidobacteriota bacterium]
MPLTTKRILSLAIPFLAAAGMMQATIISVSFQETLDLPAYSIDGPRVEQNLNVAFPSGGPQLTVANIISNPHPWTSSLNVSFDSTTNILSLTGDAANYYQVITVVLSNITFDAAQQVNGFAAVSTGNAVTSNISSAVPVSLTTAFTANSVTVSYFVNPAVQGNLFNLNTATDTFQLSLGPTGQVGSAPEPGTLMLMGFGFVGLMAFGRKSLVQAQPVLG